MRAAAVLLTVCLALPASVALPTTAGTQGLPAEEGTPTTLREHVVVSFDEAPIITDLHLPPGASAAAPVPVVLSGHGWGLDRSSQAGNSTFEALVRAGYAVVTWDARGFGQSGGEVQVDSPDFEARDVMAIIDWVAEQPEILLEAPGDPVLGMVGPSYGGGIQLVTATFDRRVDAIAPEITWHDLNRALQPQGVLKLVWQSALFGLGATTGTVQGLDPRSPAAPQSGTVPPQLFQALIQAGTTGEFDDELTAYFAQRSLSDYGPTGLLDVPTLLMQGSVDTLFTIDEAVDTYYDLRSRDVPTKLVVFCGGLDEAGSDDGAVTHGQCPTFYEPAGDRRRMDDLILRWFDEHLRGMDVDTGPPVEYRTNTGDWHRADSWPPEATQRMDVLLAGGLVSTGAPGNGFGIGAVAAPSGSPTALTIATASSTTADRQIEVVGQPTLQMDVTGTGMGANVFARLVDPGAGELPAGGSAVNNQETPLRIGALSDAPQPVEQAMVAAAYTYAPGTDLTVQLDSQSLMYTFARTGPAQLQVQGGISIPYRTLVTDRIGGPDRVSTAAELSRDSILAGDTVVIATAGDYPDALAGGPLARSLGAPLLLTPRDRLADQVRREILRIGATQAVLLGGETVLSPAVAQQLEALGLTVERIAGADRFATAAAIAERLPSTTAWVVEGANTDPARGWPDAVSAAAPAARAGDPVLLTTRDVLPTATLDALRDRGITDVVVVGGTAAVSAAVEQQLVGEGRSVVRLAGADRYTTSAAVAARDTTSRVVVATTGLDWPDALAAAGAAAGWDALLVLVDGQDLDRSGATLDLVEARAFDRLVLAGQTAAISTSEGRRLAMAADRGSVPD